MISQRSSQWIFPVGKIVLFGFLLQDRGYFRIICMVNVREKVVDHMIIETAHEKPREPIIMCDIVSGHQHVHHPTMFKTVVLIG